MRPEGIPKTQARSCTTFTPPPLDGSLTIPEIFDWHFEHSTTHPLFTYPRDGQEPRVIPWGEAVTAMYRGASMIRKNVLPQAGPEGKHVVAIVAAADTITFFTTIASIMRAGFVPFPISPRNSASAVAHLLKGVDAEHVLVGREPALVSLVENSLKQMAGTGGASVRIPQTSTIFAFEDLYPVNATTQLSPSDVPLWKKAKEDSVIIMHSSGSTAFPKIINWPNLNLLQLGLAPWFSDRDLTGSVWCQSVTPMYHGMGAMQIPWTSTCGLVMSVFEPKSPAQLPTPDSLFVSAKATNTDVICCVPSFVEDWSTKPEYVKWLATRTGVVYSGGPLNKAIGDFMTSQGVGIFVIYGMTEAGVLTPLVPAKKDLHDWDYFEFSKHSPPKMIPHGDNTFEPVISPGEYFLPAVENAPEHGKGCYATSDLLTPHPTKEGFWRVFGRVDDQLIHSNGEKTNPVPLENTLNQHPLVRSSVMFGRAKFQTGMLIDLNKPEDGTTPKSKDEILDSLWPTIEVMNKSAPQHSRLFREMVIFCKEEKPFTYTAKNTARRQAIINDYAEEIEELYALVEANSHVPVPMPEVWDLERLTEFVQQTVRAVLGRAVQDDEDLFANGCDSLQATWIRNTILRCLRERRQIDTTTLTKRFNFVYGYPTVASLAQFVLTYNPSSSEAATEANDASARIKQMHDMVDEFSHNFPQRSSSSQPPSPRETGEVVLITGTTGQLGSSLLVSLFQDPAITKVFAFNRRKTTPISLKTRHMDALVDRGLDTSVLDSDKVVLVEGDLSAPQFGLDNDLFAQISDVTRIVHNAWPVDFKMPLALFKDHVQGLRNLIDWALSSSLSTPPQLIFTTTIGIFQNVQGLASPIPEEHVDASVAVATGYTESKWVSEQVLRNANAAGLPISLVRVGQLCGSKNGSWKPTEWLPSVVLSSHALKCLPRHDKTVSWVTVDQGAKVVQKICHDHPAANPIVHMVHPSPVSWTTLASVISKTLHVPLVSFEEWLSALEEKSQPDAEGLDSVKRPWVPASALLDMFRAQAAQMTAHEADDAFEGFGFSKLASSHGVEMEPLSEKDALVWLKYWQRRGLL